MVPKCISEQPVKGLGAPCPQACRFCRPGVPSWLLMVVEPARNSSGLDWTAVSYSPPAPSLLLPPPPAAFILEVSPRQPATLPFRWPPQPGLRGGHRQPQTPARPAPPGSTCARRQPQQAPVGWRRRQVREQDRALPPSPLTYEWVFQLRGSAAGAHPAHSGVGFSHLPAPSKQLRRI